MNWMQNTIKEKLIADGYDGLASECCGCGVDDLFPCADPPMDCQPAVRRKCSKCGTVAYYASGVDDEVECSECENVFRGNRE